MGGGLLVLGVALASQAAAQTSTRTETATHTPSVTRTRTPTPGCGDGHIDEDAGEACDDGDLLGGDGCSANCTLETPRTFTISPLLSEFRLQTLGAAVAADDLGLSAHLTLVTGDAGPDGRIGVAIPAAGVVFAPIQTASVCTCIRAIAVQNRFGAGNAGGGWIGCGEGLTNVDALLEQDHVTGDIDPECVDSNPETVDSACLENEDAPPICNPRSPHDDVCNGPLDAVTSGSGGPGSASFTIALSISFLTSNNALGGCSPHPGDPIYGPDGLACTADDPDQRLPRIVPLTTGTVSSQILDANNLPDETIGPGQTCGLNPCEATITGAPFDCTALMTPQGSLDGAALALNIPVLDGVAAGDIAVGYWLNTTGGPTVTPRATRTPTDTRTPTVAMSPSPTRTATVTRTATRTRTPTESRTPQKTPTSTRTLTATWSVRPTQTRTPTRTETAAVTPTGPTQTPTSTRTITPTQPTSTRTSTATTTPSTSPSNTRLPTRTSTPTRTITQTRTRTMTFTPEPELNTPTETRTITATASPTETGPSRTPTASGTPTSTGSPTSTGLATATSTDTPLVTATATTTVTSAAVSTPTVTPLSPATSTPTTASTPTGTSTASTPTPTSPGATATSTAVAPTPTNTPIATPTEAAPPSASPTATLVSTATPSPPSAATPTSTVPALLGDLNHDGVVNNADVALLVEAIFDPQPLADADVNHDGLVSAADLIAEANAAEAQ